MSKILQALGVLGALTVLAAPALAQNGESDATYSSRSSGSWSGFPYQRFRFQIEGGETLITGAQGSDLHDGENLGFGFTFQPIAHLPLAIRADGMYERFDDRAPLLTKAAARFGTTVDWGHTEMWGGDVDAELDTLLGPRVRLYLLAGGGWYDRRDSYYQPGIAYGVFCGWYFCVSGPLEARFRVGETSTGMLFEQNAGAGLEFALGGGASLFVDARYMRFSEFGGQRLDLIPVRVGLRF